MECRIGCGACCIAISISSPLPGMPEGKKAGERCLQLDAVNRCSVHHSSSYPEVCRALTPTFEMCGSTFQQAYAYLEKLERMTT